jgi:hypothetical protein
MEEEFKKNPIVKDQIKTMEKDLQRLREKTAERERQEMLARAEKEPEKAMPQTAPFSVRKMGTDIDKFPDVGKMSPLQKDWGSIFKKIAIRFVFILIILALVGAFVYFFVLKKQEKPIETQEPVKTEQEQEKKELILPASLFKANYISFVNLESLEKTKESLITSFSGIGNDFGFYRVLFKKGEFELWSNRQVFTALNIFPAEVSAMVDDSNDENFMFFIYNSGLNKKPGFVIKFNEEKRAEFEKAVKGWEKDMEKNLLPITSLILDQKDKYYSNIFKETTFLNQKFRYKTFSKNDFGLCYAILDNKLIITTSGESIRKVISILEKI